MIWKLKRQNLEKFIRKIRKMQLKKDFYLKQKRMGYQFKKFIRSLRKNKKK